ncbi:MAG: hypothetical protein HOE90_08650 [Bacteriovoracaceae bacterium]|nr:hypothetical protein [Bacteriovoracaceae bacterium]
MEMPSSTCVIAKKLIDGFKAKHPHIKSSSRIAQLIGIKQSSINRIENLNANPSYELLVDVVIGTGNQHRIIEILGDVNGRLKDSFTENLSHLRNMKPQSDELEQVITKEEYSLILLLAMSEKGTSYNEIKAELGAHGVKNLDNLISQGILECKEGRVQRWNKEGFNLSIGTVKKVFEICLKHSYDQSLFGLGENWCSIHFGDAEKKKGTDFIRQVMKEAYEKIDTEFSSGRLDAADKSKNHTFFVGMASDVLNKSNFLSNNEGGEALQ